MRKTNLVNISTIDSPEFINLQPSDISPLISSCEIKILYVGKNRNKTVFNKDTVTQMAKTLRGNPIVGHYIEEKQDFGEHDKQIIIDNKGIHLNALTFPYGFVSPTSRVWFQKFKEVDEFGNEEIREYLMAEGYLWTEQFKECKSILNSNRPQSMELDDGSLKGTWTEDKNLGVKFFIVNDATFSKFCILGNDQEPCFEGASISAPQVSTTFSCDENFAQTLYTMMEELKNILQDKGGNSMGNLNENIQVENEISIDATPISTYSEDGGEASAAEPTTDATPSDETSEETTETPEPTPSEPVTPPAESEENIADQIACMTKAAEKKIEFSKKDDEEEKTDDSKEEKKDEKSDSSKKEEDSKEEKDDEEEKDAKKKYSLVLEELDTLKKEYSLLQEEANSLREFKAKIDNQKKDEMIASFYMLSDEDKKDVVAHKTEYSLEDIESKLSVICVRKKVSFALDEEVENEAPTVYNLNQSEADLLPPWLQAVRDSQDYE